MADTDISNLSIFHRHIEDMRNLSICKICMRSLYEPFILSCGHTYCYSCLASWFGGAHGRKSKKNCPDCRSKIRAQPSPNYLLRDLVHMFVGRVELLPEDETVQEHQQAKEEAAALLVADRLGPGLFKGVFSGPPRPQTRWGRGIPDPEDNVVRCPECHWELEDGECERCGFHEIYESGSDLASDADSESITSSGPEFDVLDDIDDDFDGTMRGGNAFDYHNGTDATDEDEEYGEDDDMDGFIDNEEHEGDDDTNSETTMTLYNRRWARNEDYDNGSEDTSYASEDSNNAVDGSTLLYDSPANSIWEVPEGVRVWSSPLASPGPPPPRWRRPNAGPRFVVSDDEDDEDDEDGGHKEAEDQDEEDEGLSESSEPDTTGDGSEYEDPSDQPPQSSARRRQYLQRQRARRNDPSNQPHSEGDQRRNRSVNQQHNHRQSGNASQNSTSGRRNGHRQPNTRLGFDR